MEDLYHNSGKRNDMMSDKDAMLAKVMSDRRVSASEASRVLEKCNWDVEKAMAASSEEVRSKAPMNPTTTKTPSHKSSRFRKKEDEMDDSISKPNERGRVTSLKYTPPAATPYSSQEKAGGARKLRDEASYSKAPSLALQQPTSSRDSRQAVSNSTSSSRRGRAPRAPVSVAPGAVAVAGVNAASIDEDEYTVTNQGAHDSPVAARPPNAVNEEEPVTATVVRDTEQDMELLQQELDRMRRERENAVVAQVVVGDEELAQHAHNVVEEQAEQGTATSHQSIETEPTSIAAKQFRKQCLRRLLSIVVVLAIIAIGGTTGYLVWRFTNTDTTPAAPTTSTPTEDDTLTSLLSKASFDGGAALRTKSTPQNEALKWLAGNTNLNEYSDERKIQRYVLATFFYSTRGSNWHNKFGWLTDTNECEWYNEAEGPFCWNGVVVEFDFFQNNLAGTIPEELALLSNSMEELQLDNNNLTGTIPSAIGLLTKLFSIDIDNNSFTGTIPTTIGKLTDLIELHLDNNLLTGRIPTEIAQLTNLSKTLQLYGNNFSGDFSCPSFIPECLISCKDKDNTECRSL